jgi:hypothetical protein
LAQQGGDSGAPLPLALERFQFVYSVL